MGLVLQSPSPIRPPYALLECSGPMYKNTSKNRQRSVDAVSRPFEWMADDPDDNRTKFELRRDIMRTMAHLQSLLEKEPQGRDREDLQDRIKLLGKELSAIPHPKKKPKDLSVVCLLHGTQMKVKRLSSSGHEYIALCRLCEAGAPHKTTRRMAKVNPNFRTATEAPADV